MPSGHAGNNLIGSIDVLKVRRQALDPPEADGTSPPKSPISAATEQAKNEHAREVVLRILDGAVWQNVHCLPHDVAVFEARVAEGYGARWSADGTQVRVLHPLISFQQNRNICKVPPSDNFSRFSVGESVTRSTSMDAIAVSLLNLSSLSILLVPSQSVDSPLCDRQIHLRCHLCLPFSTGLLSGSTNWHVAVEMGLATNAFEGESSRRLIAEACGLRH